MIIQTTVNAKYQVVIPKQVRQKVKVSPGQKLSINVIGEQIIITPKKKWPDDYIKQLGGLLKIKDVAVYLEKERNSWER